MTFLRFTGRKADSRSRSPAPRTRHRDTYYERKEPSVVSARDPAMVDLNSREDNSRPVQPQSLGQRESWDREPVPRNNGAVPTDGQTMTSRQTRESEPAANTSPGTDAKRRRLDERAPASYPRHDRSVSPERNHKAAYTPPSLARSKIMERGHDTVNGV